MRMKKLGRWFGVVTVAAPVLCAGSAQAQGQAAPATVAKTWADSVTVKGDVRYRYENIDQEGAASRSRNRVRARLGAEGKVNDDVKAGIQISTGQSDPVSGNQTLTDEYSKKDMKLDLAYFDWTWVPDRVNVVAGKMKNPFLGVQDLIWDGDLNPEGVAVKGLQSLGPVDLMANGGYMWVMERSKAADTVMYAGQLGAKAPLGENVSMLVGGSYYQYENMEGYDVLDWENKSGSYGNSTVKGSVSGSVTNKAYATEFGLSQAFAQLTWWIPQLKTPLSLYGDYVVNGEADADDTGYMYGISLGKAKNPKTCEIGYNFCELEKDAVVGAFTDSDRWGGGTDGKGHKVYARYQVSKGLQAGVTYFTDDKKLSAPVDYERIQVDLVASF